MGNIQEVKPLCFGEFTKNFAGYNCSKSATTDTMPKLGRETKQRQTLRPGIIRRHFVSVKKITRIWYLLLNPSDWSLNCLNLRTLHWWVVLLSRQNAASYQNYSFTNIWPFFPSIAVDNNFAVLIRNTSTSTRANTWAWLMYSPCTTNHFWQALSNPDLFEVDQQCACPATLLSVLAVRAVTSQGCRSSELWLGTRF